MTETFPRASGESSLTVELWLDISCPWCYLGRHRLATAVDAASPGGGVEIVLRSFELNPGMSTEPVAVTEYLAAKFAGTVERAEQIDGQVAALARAEGLPYTSDRQLANSFDVHRLLHLARDYGVANEVFWTLQGGYFAGELNPFDHDVLVGAAAHADVPAAATGSMLTGDAYADSVRKELAAGRELGISGVPFTVLGGEYAVAGAQSVDVFTEAVRTALAQATGED
ncbi:DsbA family oxidoreductase [Natronosporangium hydrolyticum]|uniref:DsbA family oxidoreductase n=1 Tax=Natronosporangium hydrolyticum TaxID=2811111 RepID=A0A895YGS9_9ACTN|nr:DsbA family oxidoreductase [Natronosporangium hydrolyticum]QSB13380.1 DsbA family oxidoreductase [Natronosporangium hydrolyticum]